jgi:hypothetical protein
MTCPTTVAATVRDAAEDASAAHAPTGTVAGMAAKTEVELLRVPGPDGPREVRLTNPDKIYFPARGIAKREVVTHYAAVAEPLLRVLY